MKSATIKCIILGHKNFYEADKIAYLYSEKFGKISAIAKGARKITSKFTGHLETLNFCTAEVYFGPKNTILKEITTDFNPFKKRRNLSTLLNALKIAEITNKMLFENMKIKNLTILLRETINILKKTRKKSLIKTAYMIKLLDKSGTIPDFKDYKSNMKKKYSKFFEFIKNHSFKQIEKIRLTKEEKLFIQKYTDELRNF